MWEYCADGECLRYVSQATDYQPESLLATKVTSVTVPGIFLSEVFNVFPSPTPTYHPPTFPHLYKLSDLLAELAGSFSAQWTITQYISVELVGWN